jgi:siroheme synthase
VRSPPQQQPSRQYNVRRLSADSRRHRQLTSISVFNTRKQAEAANTAVRELVQQTFKELLPTPPVVVVGEVVGHLANT